MHVVEVPTDERGAVIAEYLRRGRNAAAPPRRRAGPRYFGLEPDPSADEVEDVAPYYPVSRVEYPS